MVGEARPLTVPAGDAPRRLGFLCATARFDSHHSSALISRHAPAARLRPAMPANQGGGALLHEIKHDGFRVIGRKDGERVKLYSRSRGIVVPNAWRPCY